MSMPPTPTLHETNEQAWLRANIPAWREILKDSIAKQNKDREKYARWMLTSVLKVPINE